MTELISRDEAEVAGPSPEDLRTYRELGPSGFLIHYRRAQGQDPSRDYTERVAREVNRRPALRLLRVVRFFADLVS